MFRACAVRLEAARPLTGIYLFTKQKWPEYKAKIAEENPGLTHDKLFSKTRQSINEAWKAIPTEDRVAQGYWKELEGQELEKVRALAKARQEQREARKEQKQESKAVRNRFKSPKKPARTPNGFYKYIKEKYAGLKEKMMRDEPDLSNSDLSEKVTASLRKTWKNMSDQDKVSQGYLKDLPPKDIEKIRAGQAAKKERISREGTAKKSRWGASKKSDKKSAKAEPTGYFKFVKDNYAAYKAKIQAAEPQLSPKDLFLKSKASLKADWDALPKQDRQTQTFLKEVEKSTPVLNGFFKYSSEVGSAVHANVKVEFPALDDAARWAKASDRIQEGWKALSHADREAKGYYTKK